MKESCTLILVLSAGAIDLGWWVFSLLAVLLAAILGIYYFLRRHIDDELGRIRRNSLGRRNRFK